jgi:putative DNA methylase
VTSRKKLIEVALPLEAINVASAREKSIRQGHPSTLHLWWARRPLAAARAVIFAQMIDDPSSLPDLFPTQNAQQKERERLFKIIRDLVLWENTTNQQVLQRARDEIWQSWRRACADNADDPRARELFNRHKLPAFHDPFAGGGSLPLEAQRLGLEAYASDLNPVAVVINKAMIEIPPNFAGRPAVNPKARADRTLLTRQWPGATGLADDVRYYGQWMRDEAEKRLGRLYPKIEITAEMASERPDLTPLVGRFLTVIAWIWARTVKSPNPAFAGVDVPLASTFLLCTKPGKEAYVQPEISDTGYRLTVRLGKPADPQTANGTHLARGAHFQCLMSGTPIAGDYIKAEGKAGQMGARLMAVVAEGVKGRVYLSPTSEQVSIAQQAHPTWTPEGAFVEDPRAFTPCIYGIKEWKHLFTDRQLVALDEFSGLVGRARDEVMRDALVARDQAAPGTFGVEKTDASYADAVATLLALGVSRLVNRSATLNFWDSQGENIQQVFARQALSMTWDFVEGNPLSDSSGNFVGQLGYLINALLTLPAIGEGHASQQDAATQTVSEAKVISTDPPYFDNVPYADLSDFFYVWLRRSLRPIYPDLFGTLAVPKAEELAAFGYRHAGKESASAFFLNGMTQAMHRLVEQGHPAFPVTIYYAFRQSETDDDDGIASTGWDTFLDAVIQAGFSISGTWPMRTEYTGNLKTRRNALASSIILVCRPRPLDAPTATRRELVNALKAELPSALAQLQKGNIAPVDLAQAAIGPGMAVYTRFAKVLGAEGKLMAVRDALVLINQTLGEVLAEQEGDFDEDSRWALAWFDQFGFAEGEYGVAETLSKAKNTSVDGLKEAGILVTGQSKVRLLRPSELPADWDPRSDKRLTDWEIVHHLIRVLEDKEAGSESAAAELVSKLGSRAETARELCYRLYTLCERKKRAADALSYNALVQSWPEIVRLAREGAQRVEQGGQLQFGDLE